MNKELVISLQDCSFSYTKIPILKNLNLSIHRSDRVALIGKNGVGKSTLMEILSKEKIPETGEMWFHPKITFGFLKQKNFFNKKQTVEEYIKSEIEDKSHLDITYKIDKLSKNLKIDKYQQLNQLSGGGIRKISLASVIIKEPDVLFLDEPTNHLDIESIDWLEDYLKNQYNGSVLVVSHDRKFLSNITNKVFWMDRGSIKVSPRGFISFSEWSEKLIEHEKRELKNKNNLLKQELEWLSKGIKARRKRNERRKENVKLLEKDFKKQKSEFIRAISKVKFNQMEFDEIGPNVIAQFFNASKSYENNNEDIIILKKFDFKITRGEKIGLLGINGIGKSTLLKILVKKIKLDEGSLKLRDNIEYSYFDQQSDQINLDLSIKENLIPSGGDYLDVNGQKKHICGYLKNFLFDPSDINDKVFTLSGGQRNRLLLAKILANPKQLLILDEPTNDLDLETLDMLIDFLASYNGTSVIASHDRDFLDQVTTKKLYFKGKGLIDISFKSCDEILTKNSDKKNNENTNNKKIKKNDEVIVKKLKKQVPIESRIKQIIKKIEKVEDQIRENSMFLEDKNLYTENQEKFFVTTRKIEDLNKQLLELESRWKELEEENIS
ncbi:ATP-binding cassette domain-containing protein [Rickettsiales bacterium]|nr:ATP-binding cassette domain-containing protein [Rickettsiales bacterium]